MNKNEIIEVLNGEFSEKRRSARALAEKNLSLALADPEFHDVYTKLKESEFQLAKAQVYGEKSDKTENLESKIKELKKKESKIFSRLGIAKNSFEPQYNCKKCKDSGRIDGEHCSCFKTRLTEELVKISGLEISSLADFSSYDSMIASDKEQRQELEKLKDILIKFADKFGSSKYKNIVLSGRTGVGKTFALECTANEVMKKGFTVCFISAFGLGNQFVKYHSCFNANKQSYLDILLDPDLLVIDDLGTEPVLKNVTREYLYLIISERMLKGKVTLVSTNLGPNDILERYGERVFSRLNNKSKSLLLNLSGDDLRVKKK